MTAIQFQKKQKANLPPEDKKRIVYWMILICGITCYLPSDIVLTITGYWHEKLREEDEPEGSTELTDSWCLPSGLSWSSITSAQKSYLSYLTTVGMLVSFGLYIIHMFFGHLVSVHKKIIIGLIGLSWTFVMFMLMAVLDSSEWVQVFMAINLVLYSMLNFFRALFKISMSTCLGKFPQAYLGVLDNGSCLGGLVAVLINIAVLSIDMDMEMAGFTCFTMSCAICVFCLVIFLFMEKTEFFNFYNSLAQSEPTIGDIEVAECQSIAEKREPMWKVYMEVFSKCWLYLLSGTTIGITSYIIYPASTALVEPVNLNDSDWHQLYYNQVCCYLLFNIFQYLGSLSASSLKWLTGNTKTNQLIVLTLSVSRAVFTPLFMFCNLAPDSRNTEVLIANDWAYICFMVLFGFSDGYLKNVVNMAAPKTFSTPRMQDDTSNAVVAATSLGYTVGAFLSTPIVNII